MRRKRRVDQAEFHPLDPVRFRRHGSPEQIGGQHSTAVLQKIWACSFPTKSSDRIEYRHIQSQSRQSAKQESFVPSIKQRFGERASPTDRWMPVVPIFRNVFKMGVLR